MRFIHAKRKAAFFADRVGVNQMLGCIQRAAAFPFVRVINYHGTAEEYADKFEAQLAYFAKHYRSVSPTDLDDVLTGKWRHQKPGLIISFDDGIWNNATVAAPLLEKYGFCGWFFIPIDFLDLNVADQPEFARRQLIELSGAEKAHTGRLAMTWDEARRLTKNHVVGGHTYGHVRLRPHLDQMALDHEIIESKDRLESELGCPVDAFSWVGGQNPDYSAAAAETIQRAGYKYSFMTNSYPVRPGTDLLQIQRTHIESHWDLALVRFQLSGIIDAAYTRKRRRINRLTSGTIGSHIVETHG